MAIEVSKLVKDFGQPPTRVLHELSFKIEDGEFVSIVGKSGSGKSTLLYIISTLDEPTSGEIKISGMVPAKMPSPELHQFRNEQIGFVFQFHHLLPELTALENVLLPARKKKLHEVKKDQAMDLLAEFGLANKVNRLSGQLSGGEQQRVAIARALVMDPKYIFADEPTGNLDSFNGKLVMDLLMKINDERKATLVMVTHEPDFAQLAKRQIVLQDGRIVSS